MRASTLTRPIDIIVHQVDTVDEAVEYANKSDYSLMAAVWTKDVYNAYEVAARIHSGRLAASRCLVKS